MMLSDVCLSDICRIHPGGVCGRPAAWHVLADRALLGQPGSRLLVHASVAGLGGSISWQLPTYSLLVCIFAAFLHIMCHRICNYA